MKYVGDKWGGKYLRAPDIYHSILAKARGKLVRLSDVAELRRGFTSGANEFFYLDKAAVEKWEIEDEFLRPLIKSPRECRRVIVDSGDVEQHVFVCHKTKRELHGSNALAYINWGEQVPVLVKQGAKKGREVTGFHSLETVKNRHCWYDLGNRDYPNLVWTKSVDASHRQALILFEAFVDQRLYEISSPTPYLLAAVLNSFVTMLFKELEGRVNMGDGVLDTAVYEAQRILIVNPAYLAGEEGALRHLLEELAKRPIAPVWEEAATGDRKGLDEAVFDVLGLSLGDREAVYEAVTSLVHGRLDKAQSILS